MLVWVVLLYDFYVFLMIVFDILCFGVVVLSMCVSCLGDMFVCMFVGH